MNQIYFYLSSSILHRLARRGMFRNFQRFHDHFRYFKQNHIILDLRIRFAKGHQHPSRETISSGGRQFCKIDRSKGGRSGIPKVKFVPRDVRNPSHRVESIRRANIVKRRRPVASTLLPGFFAKPARV